MSSKTKYVELNGGFGGIDYVPIRRSVARKRWQQSFVSIYACRAFGSLDSVNKNIVFLRSPSYTTIDVEPNQFSSINGLRLTELLRNQDLNMLHGFGWVEGVAQALESNPENGIDGYVEDIANRRRVFGSNAYAGPRAKSFYLFLLEAFKDPMILVLLVCAALSVGFSIKKHGLWKGWYEGIINFVVVIIVATVFAGSQFWPHRHLHWLSEASYNQIEVDVNRNGQRKKISISEIVVGDVVFLKPHDQVPANGLLLSMQALQAVESDLTGKKKLIKIDPLSYPFLFYGTRVLDRYGRMLVTAVGLNTIWEGAWNPVGQIPSEQTVLHIQLQKITSFVGKAGHAVAFLVLLVSLVRHFTGNIYDEETKIIHVFVATVGILATPLMIASTAAPEGLILSFLISLVYYMKRMMEHGAVVRDLSFRSTRALTTICATKTGTLTLDRMKVNKFCLGLIPIEDGYEFISPGVIKLLWVGVGLNTNFPMEKPSFNIPSDPTEKAIFEWAIQQLGMDTQELIDNWTIWKIEAFNSRDRRSGVFVGRKDDDTIYVHRKGAPETILASCSYYCEANGDNKIITHLEGERLQRIHEGMASFGHRCIAFSYKRIAKEIFLGEELEKVLETGDWTLLGLLSLQTPCAPGVKEDVRSCYKAGLDVKMITGDNIFTARAIAAECGILEADQPGLLVVEGSEFENYTPEERLEKVDNIRVMARATPFQKYLMVECLKRNGQSVAFVGHSTGDALALSEADIGLCLRHRGTVVDERSSDMVITDGHFASAVAALFRWDRGMLENIQIFIQFQLIATIVSLMIDSVTAMSRGDPSTIDFVASLSSGKVSYPAVQLLWVKLVMGPLAAMALVLDQYFEELIHKQPRQRTNFLVTNITWRNILVHGLYQITILLTIHFKGKSIFNANTEVKSTLIFNVFVLCQVFNLLGARFIDPNSFKEIQRKKLFGGLIGMIIVIQVLMVEFLNSFAGTARLEWGHWCTCIGIAAGSLLVDWLVNRLAARKESFSRDGRKYKAL